MATASPSIGILRAQIQAIRNKAPHAKVFGIFTPSRWTGPSVDGSGGEEIAIFQCDSLLQMRLALQEAPETASAIVLLTPLDQAKVSDDILVRLARRELHPINSWEIVRSLFKAKHLDPRITRHPFLADLLLEHTGAGDLPPVAGGLLDADTVWTILLTKRLGLSGAHPDTVELLRGTAESGLAERWKACPIELRNAATDWICESAGEVARAVLTCIDSEHGARALAIGFAMGVVYHDSVGKELDKAAGRLEGYVGATNLPPETARRWRDASSVAAGQISETTLRRCLDEAESILENIGAKAHALRSDALESGFEQRLSRLGQAFTAHVASRATAISEEIQNLLTSLECHRMGRKGGRRMERVTMALRLARWLADRNGADSEKPLSLTPCSQAYVRETGFVDWARQVLRGGEPNKDLAASYVRLVDRATELREEENNRFGQVLREQRAMGEASPSLIPVEAVIEQVVAKAVEKVPVLLLLLDGMSWAVFRELVTDIKSNGWIELGVDPSPTRLIGLAALPSITEVCRTSLLCGELRRGQASDEVQGFTAHPKLASASLPGMAPKLFHKAALEGDEDSSLAGDIRQALANKKQRVVGIVVNAVDDYLDKGDQIDAIWTMQHIRVLEPILAEAGSAGRLVILLSDHGHVLDRQTEQREATGGTRWRYPGGAVAKGEVEVSSSRVVLPEGGRIVLSCSERLRYGSKKNGYHGGATPQEMLIPISMLWYKLQVPEGFGDLEDELPSWWLEPALSLPSPQEIPQAPKPSKQKTRGTQLHLFSPPAVPEPKKAPEEPWIEALLQSEVFHEQKKRVTGRVRIEDTLVERLLRALVSRGGSMTVAALAGALGVPEHRLRGLLAVVRRVINVEGYAILDRQESANTVTLNVPLLKKQFELDERDFV